MSGRRAATSRSDTRPLGTPPNARKGSRESSLLSSAQVDRVGERATRRVAHRAAHSDALARYVATPPSLRGTTTLRARRAAAARYLLHRVASRVPPIAAGRNSHDVTTAEAGCLRQRKNYLPKEKEKLCGHGARRHLSTARSPSDGHPRAKKAD
jgi:hypothetical protein